MSDITSHPKVAEFLQKYPDQSLVEILLPALNAFDAQVTTFSSPPKDMTDADISGIMAIVSDITNLAKRRIKFQNMLAMARRCFAAEPAAYACIVSAQEKVREARVLLAAIAADPNVSAEVAASAAEQVRQTESACVNVIEAQQQFDVSMNRKLIDEVMRHLDDA